MIVDGSRHVLTVWRRQRSNITASSVQLVTTHDSRLTTHEEQHWKGPSLLGLTPRTQWSPAEWCWAIIGTLGKVHLRRAYSSQSGCTVSGSLANRRDSLWRRPL